MVLKQQSLLSTDKVAIYPSGLSLNTFIRALITWVFSRGLLFKILLIFSLFVHDLHEWDISCNQFVILFPTCLSTTTKRYVSMSIRSLWMQSTHERSIYIYTTTKMSICITTTRKRPINIFVLSSLLLLFPPRSLFQVAQFVRFERYQLWRKPIVRDIDVDAFFDWGGVVIFGPRKGPQIAEKGS